jgi:hypothetical protein
MPINLIGVNLLPILILRKGHKISHPKKEGYSRIQGIFQLD